METNKSPISTILIFSFCFTILQPLSANPCKPDYCDSSLGLGPQVRFPFRLSNRGPARCGYPGFDLRCDSENRTILDLPRSGEFVVDHIDYSAQALFVNDPGSCLPARILNFSLSGSQFRAVHTRNYTFLNCSSDHTGFASARFVPMFCLSGRNYTVVATSSRAAAAEEVPSPCRPIASVLVPVRWAVAQYYWSSMDLTEDLRLGWSQPGCRTCEADGGVCGYRGDSGQEIGCFRVRSAKSGLPRAAKYALIVGVGIPGLVCIIGLTCYGCGMLRALASRRRSNHSLPSTFSDQRPIIRSAIGLDGPTIDSYPTTVLGESCRLPRPSDGTCPICLCDYRPKEMLRSIPECNHYFHTSCIDEWLKLNGTCPLCRKSPESSVATPSSSRLSAFSPSSSSSSMAMGSN